MNELQVLDSQTFKVSGAKNTEEAITWWTKEASYIMTLYQYAVRFLKRPHFSRSVAVNRLKEVYNEVHTTDDMDVVNVSSDDDECDANECEHTSLNTAVARDLQVSVNDLPEWDALVRDLECQTPEPDVDCTTLVIYDHSIPAPTDSRVALAIASSSAPVDHAGHKQARTELRKSRKRKRQGQVNHQPGQKMPVKKPASMDQPVEIMEHQPGQKTPLVKKPASRDQLEQPAPSGHLDMCVQKYMSRIRDLKALDDINTVRILALKERGCIIYQVKD